MLGRYRRAAVSLLLRLSLLGAGWAQHARGSQPASQPRRLTRVNATYPTATVYLVGSIHLGDTGLYPLPPEVEAAFTAARVLAVEFDVRKVDQATANKLTQQYGTYPEGDSLAKHLPAETS